ncbi:DUF1465 family protein [Sphingobium bisphenolivorans]|uniref:DUF1465 family protein n=1 Tax=Sphingobium bisphenolivorans TaxID=1335760 RepID=UPI00039C3D26|nr:DUF1465 family protein [Sphingobium bisphenolivorans]
MYPVLTPDPGLHTRLVDGLYVEAMVMADEARAYFDVREAADLEMEDPIRRVSFACESLKVTTRLMHIIAWLLSQRAWQRGEISADELSNDKYRLGHAAGTDPAIASTFPFAARALIEASQDLYDRVARLQDRMGVPRSQPTASPARALLDRLNTAF